MAGREDPVLSYLDDVLGTCVDTLIRVSLLSEFIDDEDALDLAKGIRKRMLELRRDTLRWRNHRREFDPPRPRRDRLGIDTACHLCYNERETMGKTNEVWLNQRIPRKLLDRIKAQMKTEQRGNRSEMVRILIEDGLKARQAGGG